MLKKQGLNNVKLCADPAFTMEKEELELPNGWQEGNTIGLNFSPLVGKETRIASCGKRSYQSYIKILQINDCSNTSRYGKWEQ